MESWSAHTPSPSLKFENSPTESLLSTPGEMYPSLFGTDNAPPTTLNPLDMLTPKSFAQPDEGDVSVLGLTPAPETPAPEAASTEKKPVKKRKSWGQVLPEPKTNLPPRKRAKTEDEKEQRRVERVLRNRRAAQSSRERKRQEVEGLERRNKELEAMLRHAQQANMALVEELRKARGGSGAMSRTPTSFEALRPSPVTFSQELFSSQDGHGLPTSEASSIEQLLTTVPNSNSNTTVNPAALSPTLTPVPEEAEEDDNKHSVSATDATQLADAAAPEVGASPDATQHPAEMLWQDLQCRSAEAPPSAWLVTSQRQSPSALALFWALQVLLVSTSTMLSLCQRPLTQIAMSLKAGFSLPPTPAIMNTIIWLVTTPNPSRSRPQATSSTSATSLPTTQASCPATSSSRSTLPTAARSQTRRSSTLRLKSLRKILTCSPSLARPLMDATMEALRLVSSEADAVSRVSEDGASATATAGGKSQWQSQHGGQTPWLNGAKLPSKEVLLTLLWVLKVEERRLEIRKQVGESSKLGRPIVPQTLASTRPFVNDNHITNNQRYFLKVFPKRSLEEDTRTASGISLKRRRAAE